MDNNPMARAPSSIGAQRVAMMQEKTRGSRREGGVLLRGPTNISGDGGGGAPDDDEHLPLMPTLSKS